MRLDGWIFMLASWSVIIGLTVYCFIRTLRSNKKNSENDLKD